MGFAGIRAEPHLSFIARPSPKICSSQTFRPLQLHHGAAHVLAHVEQGGQGSAGHGRCYSRPSAGCCVPLARLLSEVCQVVARLRQRKQVRSEACFGQRRLRQAAAALRPCWHQDTNTALAADRVMLGAEQPPPPCSSHERTHLLWRHMAAQSVRQADAQAPGRDLKHDAPHAHARDQLLHMLVYRGVVQEVSSGAPLPQGLGCGRQGGTCSGAQRTRSHTHARTQAHMHAHTHAHIHARTHAQGQTHLELKQLHELWDLACQGGGRQEGGFCILRASIRPLPTPLCVLRMRRA